ncbi:NAD(P)-dependent oxidoreductase [Guptibacillus hwajinpoensis]|uniref:NADH-flavin reductase n=1 Tax=Guptibacillus hwajinpoensis TaxID=208199 RepID=A0ABU0K2F7_9BACL|nr:SDR family oxidoreductase [Alkalihalobacillus hemicentroti]MDQ0483547.1 putative NADH-flavin reductase [Alkalihalobacillus hemicentroti]
MRILLLGATGRVGSDVLKLAVADHHEMKVLVRSPEKLATQENVTVIEGNVLDEQLLEEAVKGVDVVVSALSTDKTTTLSESIPMLISAMEKHQIKRIVTVGTAGILNSRTEPSLYRFESSESKRKTTRAAEEHLSVYKHLAASELDWTIVCPTYLPDGDAVGGYRINEDVLPENGREISVGDTADFVYRTLMNNTHQKKRVGIAY